MKKLINIDRYRNVGPLREHNGAQPAF